jgi:hypothetical protein
MNEIVSMFLGLALIISITGDQITYAIVGRPGGGIKPWAKTLGRILGGILGAAPGAFLGSVYITGAVGLLGIVIGPTFLSMAFPPRKTEEIADQTAGSPKNLPNLMNFSGNELLSLVASEEETRTKVGETYIYGVYDGLAVAALVANVEPYFTMPHGWNLEQLRDTVVNSLRRQPEQLHNPASLLIHNALKVAFPSGR